MKKIKYKVRDHFNYEPEEGEINSGELLTVPDDAYTIEEIIDKFTKGIRLDIMESHGYSDSDDFDDIDGRSQIIDLTDIPELHEQMVQRRKKKSAEKKTFVSETKPKEDEKPIE